MNTKDLFDLVGTVTVSKNYVGDITIPNVPGIDNEGGHDKWATKMVFSNGEDLTRLIEESKRPWFKGYGFPLQITTEGDSVSVSYTGAEAYNIAQVLMCTDSDDDLVAGMDSLITWVCGVVNVIRDHVSEDTGKVSVITKDIIVEMSKEEAYVTVRKVLDYGEISDYPKAEEALRVAAHCMERMLKLEHKEDNFNVSEWDAVYDLRDLIEDDDYEDIVIVGKHREAIGKAYRCLRASI